MREFASIYHLHLSLKYSSINSLRCRFDIPLCTLNLVFRSVLIASRILFVLGIGISVLSYQVQSHLRSQAMCLFLLVIPDICVIELCRICASGSGHRQTIVRCCLYQVITRSMEMVMCWRRRSIWNRLQPRTFEYDMHRYQVSVHRRSTKNLRNKSVIRINIQTIILLQLTKGCPTELLGSPFIRYGLSERLWHKPSTCRIGT